MQAITLREIEKAINTADIGINPQNDGKVIRLSFPQLTEEHRKNLQKDISKRGEEAKVAIRNVRRDAMDDIKKLKKDNEITEDEQKDGEKKLQDITDDFVKQADSITKKKEEEITSEEKEDMTNTNKKIDELVEQRTSILSEYAGGNKLVSQLIDLALLANGMLKGEALSQFIKRSVQMIG